MILIQLSDSKRPVSDPDHFGAVVACGWLISRGRVLSRERGTSGRPKNIRSDNGSEFTATAVRSWLLELGVSTLYIEPGSPWENGHIQSFNEKCAGPPILWPLRFSPKHRPCAGPAFSRPAFWSVDTFIADIPEVP